MPYTAIPTSPALFTVLLRIIPLVVNPCSSDISIPHLAALDNVLFSRIIFSAPNTLMLFTYGIEVVKFLTPQFFDGITPFLYTYNTTPLSGASVYPAFITRLCPLPSKIVLDGTMMIPKAPLVFLYTSISLVSCTTLPALSCKNWLRSSTSLPVYCTVFVGNPLNALLTEDSTVSIAASGFIRSERLSPNAFNLDTTCIPLNESVDLSADKSYFLL